ncbi:hypothetical protein N752_26085 [Desulforamulus aquiferis]|nr:hypothetical protein [Desulforamulus aquiferis]RYD02286.1 hypothetical protein N752_26085 [Desulforamulus aquiferis]
MVVEPGQRSFQTAAATVRLAKDLGVEKVFAVINKVHPGQEESVCRFLDFLPLLGILPFNPSVIEADLTGTPVFETNGQMVQLAEQIKDKLENNV